MRRFTFVVVAVSVVLGYSGSAAGMTGPSEVVVVNEPLAVDVTNDPLPVEVTNPSPASPTARFQLVGFTSASNFGNEGVLGFTLNCQAEFPDSRMCTSQEVMETVTVPGSLTGSAWVRPVFVPLGTGAVIIAARDISGVVVGSGIDLACDGWRSRSLSQRGLAVSATGSFASSACDQAFGVACCALVP